MNIQQDTPIIQSPSTDSSMDDINQLEQHAPISKLEQVFNDETSFSDYLSIKYSKQASNLNRNISYRRQNLEHREFLEKQFLEAKFKREYNKRFDKFKTDFKAKIQKKRLDAFNKEKKAIKEREKFEKELAELSN